MYILRDNLEIFQRLLVTWHVLANQMCGIFKEGINTSRVACGEAIAVEGRRSVPRKSDGIMDTVSHPQLQGFLQSALTINAGYYDKIFNICVGLKSAFEPILAIAGIVSRRPLQMEASFVGLDNFTQITRKYEWCPWKSGSKLFCLFSWSFWLSFCVKNRLI